MVQDAERDCDVNPRRFDDLIDEQTPGGLNEQVGSSMDSPPREIHGDEHGPLHSFSWHFLNMFGLVPYFPLFSLPV